MSLDRPLLAATLALGLVAGPAAHAASIAIENPGFEANHLGDGSFAIAPPTGWTVLSIGGLGPFNPTTGESVAPTEGVNVAYVNDGAGIKQTLSSTAAAGEYVLTADFAFRKDCCSLVPALTMSLLSGSTVLGSFEVNKAAGFSNTAFKSATLDVILLNGSPLIGGPLSISLQGHSGAGDQVMVDNVALNFTAAAPVPLPASAWLLMPAMAGLAGLARRKARA